MDVREEVIEAADLLREAGMEGEADQMSESFSNMRNSFSFNDLAFSDVADAEPRERTGTSGSLLEQALAYEQAQLEAGKSVLEESRSATPPLEQSAAYLWMVESSSSLHDMDPSAGYDGRRHTWTGIGEDEEYEGRRDSLCNASAKQLLAIGMPSKEVLQLTVPIEQGMATIETILKEITKNHCVFQEETGGDRKWTMSVQIPDPKGDTIDIMFRLSDDGDVVTAKRLGGDSVAFGKVIRTLKSCLEALKKPESSPERVGKRAKAKNTVMNVMNKVRGLFSKSKEAPN